MKLEIYDIRNANAYCKFVAPLAAELFKICDTPALQYDILCVCDMMGVNEKDELEKLKDLEYAKKHNGMRMYYQAHTVQKFYGFTSDITEGAVGVVGFEYIDLPEFKEYVSISWTVTKENCRSMGIGSEMLKKIENEIKILRPHCKTLIVESDRYKYVPGCDWIIDNDKRTVKFYEKNGYINLGKVSKVKKEGLLPAEFFEDDKDEVLIKKI